MVREGKRFRKGLIRCLCLYHLLEDSLILLVRIKFEMVMPWKFRNVTLAGVGVGFVDSDKIEIPVEKYKRSDR